ncbi:glutathione S-transferase theta 1 L homeolog [Xenopus laevis]|uniref:glutathione transferase n=2 Tax=Xenopus laevis TaxID=8355 RepID=Q6INS0_XENLA|nr:glutathione S-transferase theta 1 L homeolog [Xenopus laevis]AAH72203.1 MGC81156 protein [Xenopus laevis]OCU01841.1 hypothetical protein XELAEV_18007619mg [Xenopus laevis]
MADLTLYLDLMSQPCRSVYIFAKANKIPFNNHQVRLFKGDHFSEEFGKVNVLRKVPALKDGDFLMAESTAMLLYMARKYKTPDHWYPSDLQKCARVDEYLAWQHTNTRPHGSKVFWVKCLTPLILGQEAPAEKVDAVVTEFNTSMKNLEEKFLGDKLFIAGDEISVADLVAIVEIMQVMAGDINPFDDRPKLAAWKKRVVEALGEELFMEAHKEILNSKQMASEPLPPELLEFLKCKLQAMK